jgi:hypothetical protein
VHGVLGPYIRELLASRFSSELYRCALREATSERVFSTGSGKRMSSPTEEPKPQAIRKSLNPISHNFQMVCTLQQCE